MEDLVLLEIKDGIGKITLNNPKGFNSIDPALANQLFAKVRECVESKNVHAVVLTGAGKAFCAGGNLKQAHEASEPVSVILGDVLAPMNRTISLIRRSEKPFIAAVNGVAAGGGLGLMMSCDMRVASETAVFVQAYTSNGLTPDIGFTIFAPALIGESRTMELILTDPTLDAKTALSWGLVNEVCTPEQTMPRAMEIAARVAKGATWAIGRSKRMVMRGTLRHLETALEEERQAMMRSSASAEGHEGVAAFVQKRKPDYTKITREK